MSLLDDILGANDGAAVREIARSLGIDQEQVRTGASQLIPALSRGIKNSASSQDGMAALLGALSSGNHGRYLDHPQDLERPETLQDGNGILGHIFGSKDVSRQVATAAAARTGLDSGILKQMLPMLAALAMGAMSKQTSTLASSATGAAGGGNLNMLTRMLDADQDGSIADDLLGLAGRLFSGR